MQIKGLPSGFDGPGSDEQRYQDDSVSPEIAGIARSLRSEIEARAGKVRCPECGGLVASYFDHVDMDCTGAYPEKVAAGFLRARDQ